VRGLGALKVVQQIEKIGRSEVPQTARPKQWPSLRFSVSLQQRISDWSLLWSNMYFLIREGVAHHSFGCAPLAPL